VCCLFGVLYISAQYVFVLGAISLISYILSCFGFFYYRYLSEKTLNNLIELNIIETNQLEETIHILNIIALIDTTSFAHSFKWFVNKILGYRW
jgi:glucan phosphoethanolaminetransferase (alkaline phosphatase superfamily)